MPVLRPPSRIAWIRCSQPALQRSIRGLGAVFLVLASVLAGCAQQPHQQVGKGIEPSYVDKNVRFRTTYYFRVVDLCRSDTSGGNIAIDSLYRFRMTGKAHPGLTKVKFESGTLSAQQIDPFGAQIGFDEESGSHYFLSSREVKAKVRLAELKRSIETLNAIDTDNPLAAEFGRAVSALLESQSLSLKSVTMLTPVSPSGETHSSALASARRYLSSAQDRYAQRRLELSHVVGVYKQLADQANDLASLLPIVVASKEALASAKMTHEMEKKDLAEKADPSREDRARVTTSKAALDAASTAYQADSARADELRRWLSLRFESVSSRLIDIQSRAGEADLGAGKAVLTAGQELARSFSNDVWNTLLEDQKKALSVPQKTAVNTVKDNTTSEGNAPTLKWVGDFLEAVPEKMWLDQAEDVVEKVGDFVISNPGTYHGGESKAGLNCDQTQRGFQILGPEGWRTFDPDERLLLAMTSSAKPLIQSLQALSQRIANSRAVDTRDVDVAIAISREEIATFLAELERANRGDAGQAAAEVRTIRAILDRRTRPLVSTTNSDAEGEGSS